MFPLPYRPPFDALLYALMGLDLALLGGGLLFGRYDPAKMGRLPLGARMGLSGLLVVAALLQRRLVAPPLAGCAGWVLLGMGLGFLGDLIMAEVLRVPSRLICGLLAFGLGNICYAGAFVGMSVALGLWELRLALAVWAAVALVAVGLWHRFVRRPGGDRILNGGALIYSLLMATINALAIALAVREARFIPLAVGTALFLTSDLLLGNWSIRGHAWKGANDAVWVTYNLGQALIVFSVAAAASAALAG